MLFQDAILEFGFDCKVRKLSPKSITNYQKQLRYLQNYLEQEYRIKSVEQVRTAHIKMFLAMMDGKAIVEVIESLAKMLPEISICYYFHSQEEDGIEYSHDLYFAKVTAMQTPAAG